MYRRVYKRIFRKNNGNYDEYSDIDLLIVSPIFEGQRLKDRDKVRKITLRVSSDLEVIPCSRQDFSTDNPFIKEILRYGIRFKTAA